MENCSTSPGGRRYNIANLLDQQRSSLPTWVGGADISPVRENL